MGGRRRPVEAASDDALPVDDGDHRYYCCLESGEKNAFMAITGFIESFTKSVATLKILGRKAIDACSVEEKI